MDDDVLTVIMYLQGLKHKKKEVTLEYISYMGDTIPLGYGLITAIKPMDMGKIRIILKDADGGVSMIPFDPAYTIITTFADQMGEKPNG